MTGQSSERTLDASDVYGVLATQGFGGERAGAHAIVIALQDPLHVVWANAGATTLFGSDEAAVLSTHLFRTGGRDGIASIVGRIVLGGGGRTERLRLRKGFQARTVTASVSGQRLADGTGVLVVAVPLSEAECGYDGHRDALKRAALPARAAPMGRREPQSSRNEPSIVDGSETTLPPSLVGRRPARFLWQTDGAGRLTQVSEIAGDLADLHPAMAIGQSFAALAARHCGEAAAPLQAALATPRAFSGVALSWPLEGGEGTVAVTLGATPVRRDSDQLAGFRGFGVIDYRRFNPVPAPSVPQQDVEPVLAAEPDLAIAPTPAPEPEPAPELVLDRAVVETATADPADAGVTADALPSMAEPADPETETVVAEPPPAVERARYVTGVRASFSSAKIVALHPFKVVSGTDQPVAGGTGVSGPPLRRRSDMETAEPEATPADPGAELSTVEQFNFDEIARALRNAAAETVATGGLAAVSSAADDNAALLAALPVPLLVDRKGRIVYANAAFLALTGFASARAIERAGGRTHLLGGLDAAQVAGVDEERAFPIVDANGGVISVAGRIAVIEWSGAPAELLTVRPTSDRVAEVQSLQIEIRRREEERTHYRALLDRTADAVVTVDGQGRLLMMNATAERLFAREELATAGESIGLLLTPDCQSAALGAIFAASTAGPDAPEAVVAVMGRRPDAATMPLRMTLRALGPGKIGIVLHDETEVDTLRQDLQQSRAEADQTGTLRSAFLAKVSHEIRTPLNAIIGFAEIMLDERFGPIGNPRYKDYLGDIRESGKHVIDLVADLLDLSAMQAGRHDLDVVATDVNRTVSECVAALQGSAHRDRIIMRLSLLPQLPQALVDQKALTQIMEHVLVNAIRFNEPGGQVIVSTAVTETGGITIRVRDTGVGMSEAELAVATEPFRQISTGKPGGGSGLGLPLTRALVDASQATMSIKSRKGEGTLVEIVLRPATDASVSAPAA